MKCSHPRSAQQLRWFTDSISKRSSIVGASCTKCGDELNVSTPRGNYVAGPRLPGQERMAPVLHDPDGAA